MRGIPIMERNEFPFSEMVSHTLPLERVSEGFHALAGGYHLDGKDAVKIALSAWFHKHYYVCPEHYL